MQSGNTKSATTWDGETIPRILPMVLQNLRFIIVMTIIGAIVGFVAVLSVKPRYEVTGTLMLQLGHELAAPPTVDESRVMPQGKRSEDLANEIEIMSSQGLVKELVEHFGEEYFTKEVPAVTFTQKAKRVVSKTINSVRETLDDTIVALGIRRKLSKKESIVLALQSSLAVEPARKSDITRVSLQINDPEVGEQILSKFVELYLAKHVAIFKSSKTKPFFETETAGIMERIKKLQDDRLEYKKANSVSSTEIERKLLLDQAETTRATKFDLVGEKSRLLAEIDYSSKRLPTLPRELQTSNIQQRNPLLSNLETKLSGLEADRDLAKLRYNDASRTITDLESQISLFKPKLGGIQPLVTQSITTGLNAAVLDMEREIDGKQTQVAGLNARIDELDKMLKAVEARLANLEVAENKLRDIERELIQTETTYTMYRKSTDQAELVDAMNSANMSNVVIVDPPTASLRPVWPNAKIWLAAGALAGAFLSLGYALLTDTINPAVRSAADINNSTGINVLAAIPNRARSNGRAYRQLAIDLRKLLGESPSLAILSAHEQKETKTFSVELARALLIDGAKSVLLIDASPTGALDYPINSIRSSKLSDWQPGLPIPAQPTADAGISFLSFGTDLLKADSQAKLQALQAESTQQFDFVIFAAPGILSHPEVKRVASIVKSVLLVVDSHVSKISDLRELRQQLDRSREIHPVGAAMNRIDRFVPRLMRANNDVG